MKISKRIREEAALILAHCASGREFAVYTSDAAEWLEMPLDTGAHRLAFDAADHVQRITLAGWRREDYAEAEALLRCGWSPE